MYAASLPKLSYVHDYKKIMKLFKALGVPIETTCLLGVALGHNSSFLQGPAFAPPRIREAIWCGSTNSATEKGTW